MRPFPRRQWILGGVAALIAWGVALARFGSFAGRPAPDATERPAPDATMAQLSDSPYLRDVVEPIAMVRGSSTAGSDDHWMGITFRDAKGIEREAKFVFYWPELANTPEIVRKLILDRPVPDGGPEEKACLGMLQRWRRQEAEVPALMDRVKRRDPTLGRTLTGWSGLTDAQAGKVVAVFIMEILERRP